MNYECKRLNKNYITVWSRSWCNFCDSSYGSLDYEDYETDRDLMIGKDVTICCGFYDRDIDSVIQVDYTDSRVNCLELSIQDFQLDH